MNRVMNVVSVQWN